MEDTIRDRFPERGDTLRTLERVVHHDGGETLIESNGSTWGGQSPEPLSEFERRLQENTLDPEFEEYGNFYTLTRDAFNGIVPECYQPYAWHFWGNFADVSGVFCIFTSHEPTAERLIDLINGNRETDAYAQAKREQLASAAEWYRLGEESRRRQLSEQRQRARQVLGL